MSIYPLSDEVIQQRIGAKLKLLRLRQNITQSDLAHDAQISPSTVKKIEKGEITSFANLIKIMRVLGNLDALQQLVEDEEMSPNEYYEYVNSKKLKRRQRATGPKKIIEDDDDNDNDDWSKWLI